VPGMLERDPHRRQARAPRADSAEGEKAAQGQADQRRHWQQAEVTGGRHQGGAQGSQNMFDKTSPFSLLGSPDDIHVGVVAAKEAQASQCRHCASLFPPPTPPSDSNRINSPNCQDSVIPCWTSLENPRSKTRPILASWAHQTAVRA
jgi:hypothetical protein